MIAEIWNTVAGGEETTLEQRARCRLASTYAADSAREAMDLVYRLGGSTSFKRASRLAECWRDLHVVGQTVTIAPEWYPIARAGAAGDGYRAAAKVGERERDGRTPLRSGAAQPSKDGPRHALATPCRHARDQNSCQQDVERAQHHIVMPQQRRDGMARFALWHRGDRLRQHRMALSAALEHWISDLEYWITVTAVRLSPC